MLLFRFVLNTCHVVKSCTTTTMFAACLLWITCYTEQSYVRKYLMYSLIIVFERIDG